MRTTIVFQSEYGQTRKIAEAIKEKLDTLSNRDDFTEVLEISKDRDVSHFSLGENVIIGTPVYVGQFPKLLRKWLEKNFKVLSERHVSLYTVSLNAADTSIRARATDDELLSKFIQTVQVKPNFVASFGGSLSYTRYPFWIKFIMKRISKAAGGPIETGMNFDLTNWEAVTDFVNALLSNNKASIYFAATRFPDLDARMKPDENIFLQIWRFFSRKNLNGLFSK